MLTFRLILLLFTTLTASVSVKADGIADLHAFVASTRTATADFTQDVYNRHHQLRQHASGTLAFSRPGRFRWVYGDPVDQTIVGDGHTLWLYDAGLDQVTERQLGRALGNSPAALLAGDNDIDRYYTLQADGQHDGLEWLIATPRQQDGSFRRIHMGFHAGMLARMIIEDNFGSTTDLRLQNLRSNPHLPASTFTFTPPASADVISDLK